VFTGTPKVAVLLATFNGVSFLDEQLNSLNEQQDVEVEVFVIDDGSVDGTMKILETWKKKGLIVSIAEGNGLGSTKAFLRLLQECNEKPFIAFCDQDDIWEPNKLAMQIKLCEEDIPTIVFSRRKYLHSSGKSVGISSKLKKSPSFGNALIENIAFGNTVLLNLPAIKVVNTYVFPDIAHYDSWIYLLISNFGKCKNINEPLVHYRIHENNQVGLRKLSLKRFELSALHFIHQASYLSQVSKPALSEKNRLILANFISVLQAKGKGRKARAIWNTKFCRQRLIDQIGYKVIFLILVIKGKI
jgi:glycosyltransferase involved in cell wall biosynthesis